MRGAAHSCGLLLTCGTISWLAVGCGSPLPAPEPAPAEQLPAPQNPADEDPLTWWEPQTPGPDKAPQAPSLGRSYPIDSEWRTIPLTISGVVRGVKDELQLGATVYLNVNGKNCATAKTGADGAYSFRQVRVPLAYPREMALVPNDIWICAETPGLGVTAFCNVEFFNRQREGDRRDERRFYLGEQLAFDLKHAPPGEFSGRVLDEKGDPVSGARVQLDWMSSRAGFFRDGDARGQTTTGADGRFKFGELPTGAAIQAQVIAPGRPAYRVCGWVGEGEKPETVVRFVPARPLRVRVHERDNPERPGSFARVDARQRQEKWDGREPRAEAFAVVGRDGTAVLWVPPGEYSVRVCHSEFLPFTPLLEDTVRVPDNDAGAQKNLRVRPLYVLDVLALDADTGKPLPGARGLATHSLQEGHRTYFTNLDFGPTRADGRSRVVCDLRNEAARPIQMTYKDVVCPGYEPVDLPSGPVLFPQHGQRDLLVLKFRTKK